MTDVARTRLALTAAAVTVALLLASVGLQIAFGLLGSDGYWVTVVAIGGCCAMAAVGALIAARVANPIGWILLAIPLCTGLSQVAQSFSDHGVPLHAGYGPFAHWISQWPFFTALVLLLAIFYLYPTGTLPSPRWRWVWRAYVTAGVVTVVGFAVQPASERVGGVSVGNPFGIDAISGLLGGILLVSGLTLVLSAFASFASLAVRYRGAGPEQRQQLRWLFAVGGIGATMFLLFFATLMLVGERTWVDDVLFMGLAIDVVFGIPLATAVAILHYRLYDLDVVVKKTVIFAVLAIFITLVYVVVVGGMSAVVGSGGNTAASLVAAAVLAMAFEPVRNRARRFADRIVYGSRATPYEVLADLSGQVAGAYATEDVLPRMAQVLAAGTGATLARVWLRVGGELRPAAVAPGSDDEPGSIQVHGDALPPFPAEVSAAEVRDRGELLGALTVEMPANDPIDPGKERLVEDLAAQAGLVLRNARLIEELRASRQRLVAAQDEERRKIERDLHDGAQQQLVALTVQLKLARTLAERDPAKAAELVTGLQATAGDALEDLRDLARGIYPPLLADQGLAAALEGQARRAAIPVSVEASGIGRYPREVESAVYFCSLEALNNVAKYAGASRAEVVLERSDGRLSFTIRDDGAGFDPSVTGYGTGLHGMADRLDAIGGDLEVESEPGRGTVVRGRVPVGAEAGAS